MAAKEQEEGLKSELAKIKEDLMEREKRWEEEKREIKERIYEMEGKLKVLEIGKVKMEQRGRDEGKGEVEKGQ